jgi:hypothetical protein
MTTLLTDKPLAELKAIRAHLVRQLRRIGPELIEGSPAVIGSRCGNPGCRCARGEKHLKHILTRKVEGKSHTTYIPLELVEDVHRWVREYKRAKQLLKEISEVNEAIIRGHGSRQRQKEKTARQLGLLEE